MIPHFCFTYIFKLKFVIIQLGDFMKFEVSIEQFDGPLDLMLHLVKENKLDLFDLDMDVLASQYITFIHDMQTLHLEVASEYLEELASLIEYKSKKLLPREEVEVKEEYEEDQRDRLVARLIEYQQYKEISNYFKDSFSQRQKHFTRPSSSLIEGWKKSNDSAPLKEQSAYYLMKAMHRVLKRQALLNPYETKMTIKELSTEERVEQIKLKFNGLTSKMTFEECCHDCIDLHMVIVTFLGILDLIHQKWLSFTIDENEEIWIWKGVEYDESKGNN